MKLLNERIHGYLDYVVVISFLLAPSLFGFSGLPAILSYLLAGVHLLLTLFTDFSTGLFKVLSLKIHGWIELVVAPTLAGLPWLAGFSDLQSARNFYIGAGVIVFLTWLVTDYEARSSLR
ncbi:MAG TPA: hypothetical protein VNJ08_16605 [Bacteriovoracaceae bacterium]|nr:hypothetical protein [Bacteriovoracaceae bacterium]